MEKNAKVALYVCIAMIITTILLGILVLATMKPYKELDYVDADGLEVEKTVLKTLGGLFYV